jgi:hypothetical protein
MPGRFAAAFAAAGKCRIFIGWNQHSGKILLLLSTKQRIVKLND